MGERLKEVEGDKQPVFLTLGLYSRDPETPLPQTSCVTLGESFNLCLLNQDGSAMAGMLKGGKSGSSQGRQIWIGVPALLLPDCVTLGKELKLSGPGL